jgi:hypothetical protein
MTHLIVGLDLAPWHKNIRADAVATAARLAVSHAVVNGITLVLAANIGPNSGVLQGVAVQPATSSKAA